MRALEFKYNSMAKSAAQIQREFRNRLKGKDPELLRAQDHEKYRRRCLRRKCRTSVPVRTADSHFIDIPHRDLELKQHDDLNQSSSLKLYPIEERIHNMYDENRAMMEQDVSNRLRNTELNEKAKCFLIGRDKSAESSVSVKYPIHGLLKWLENVNVDEDVKYGFLKYVCSEKRSGDDCNKGEAKGESDKNHVQSQHSNARKRTPLESSSESGMSDRLCAKDRYHEKTERAITRPHKKSGKKMRHKAITKQTAKRRKLDITWEPLYFDDDESQENYE